MRDAMDPADAGVVPGVDDGTSFDVDDRDTAGAVLATVERGVDDPVIGGERGEVAERARSCEVEGLGDGAGAGVDEGESGRCAAHADDQGVFVAGEQHRLGLVADGDLADDAGARSMTSMSSSPRADT